MRLTLKRLCAKYNTPIRGKTYQDLVSQIIDYNQQKAIKTSQSLSRRRYERGLKDAIATGEIKLPPYVPIPTARKSAQSGERLLQHVHDQMTYSVRMAINLHPDDPDAAIKQMRLSTEVVMAPYADGDPPPHCETIAITEVRAALNLSKYEYAKHLAAAGLKVKKIWRHSGHPKVPRPGHLALEGAEVDFARNFAVVGKHGRVWMMYPHAPDAPADETIGCGCSYDIEVTGTKRGTEAK
ncbi:MAG: phage head morphogenesis protein, partial [Treponema sp.]|nr:phage head morphogenesis protein [Treponema sp.]